MNLLVTGGAGFIGSNYITYMLNKYPQYRIITLDLLTYAGNLRNLRDAEKHTNFEFIQGNICDRELVDYLFEKYCLQGVIHFAAESHVDNSIKNPSIFIETNVNGTFTLLDVARNHWMESSAIVKKEYRNSRFHHVSTDEVYGTLGDKGFFTEESPYAPNSPYSASKAASDMLVRSYYHTYGMNVVTTNCSNNFGPRQHSEKLIPTIIRKAMNFEDIPIYGSGMHVRDWLYVEDHCRAIDLVFHEGNKGETYLIGGHNEKTNLEIANDICGILDEKLFHKLEKRNMKSFKELITFVEDRAGHDFRYAIDSSKIQNELKFECKDNMKSILNKLINQYLMEG